MLTAYLPLLFSAMAFIISVSSFFYFRADIKTRTSQKRFLSEIREEVNGIIKSINETTDRDISLIEEREKNLKALLAEIEKRLKVYIKEVEVRRGAEEAYRELGKNRYRFRQDPLRESDLRKSDSLKSEARREAVQQERPRDYEGSAPANTAFPIPEFRVKSETAQDAPGENPLPVGEQILSLVKAGFSVPVIASRLGISVAEVEFAAALLERRDAL
jgi:hypothetical protein